MLPQAWGRSANLARCALRCRVTAWQTGTTKLTMIQWLSPPAARIAGVGQAQLLHTVTLRAVAMVLLQLAVCPALQQGAQYGQTGLEWQRDAASSCPAASASPAGQPYALHLMCNRGP